MRVWEVRSSCAPQSPQVCADNCIRCQKRGCHVAGIHGQTAAVHAPSRLAVQHVVRVSLTVFPVHPTLSGRHQVRLIEQLMFPHSGRKPASPWRHSPVSTESGAPSIWRFIMTAASRPPASALTTVAGPVVTSPAANIPSLAGAVVLTGLYSSPVRLNPAYTVQEAQVRSLSHCHKHHIRLFFHLSGFIVYRCKASFPVQCGDTRLKPDACYPVLLRRYGFLKDFQGAPAVLNLNPSSRTRSISSLPAGICSLDSRQIMVTFGTPRRFAVTATSTATLPPPTTTTSEPGRSMDIAVYLHQEIQAEPCQLLT